MKIEWNKVTWYSKIIAMILFIALPFIGFYAGVWYQDKVTLSSTRTVEESDEKTEFTSESRLSQVNVDAFYPYDSTVYADVPKAEEKIAPYLIYQVTYPSRYLATTYEMISSYNNQGGIGGSPDLILSESSQPLTKGSLSWTDNIINLLESGEDCVMVWSSWNEKPKPKDEQGWVQTWGGNSGSAFNRDFKLVSREDITLGSYKVIWEEINETKSNTKMFGATIYSISQASYDFLTCNQNNIDDLETIIEKFDIRLNAIPN